MTLQEQNDYFLSGSPHTMEIKTMGMVEPTEEIAPCIKCISRTKNGEIYTCAIINPHKLYGDITSFSEFNSAMDIILSGCNIQEYKITRVDFRLDSFDENHYKRYQKLNRYLISMIALTYKIKNCYRTTNLFSDELLSVAIKNKYIEVESYDKEQESNGTDPAMSRFELRSKALLDNDIKKEFMVHWFNRLDKSMKNIDKVEKRYNDELYNIYINNKNKYPKQFTSIREFIMLYQNCIFSKCQLVDLLTRIDDCINPEEYAKKYISRYGLEFFSKSDIEFAINEIKRAITIFFEN